jgi:hypothetical protein
MKKSTLIAFVALMFVALAGCHKKVIQNKNTPIYTLVNYKVVEINKNGSFKVSLQDDAGKIFKDMQFSTNCDLWKDVKVGSTIQLPTATISAGMLSWVEIQSNSACTHL